jgi:predicted dehydrogenase
MNVAFVGCGYVFDIYMRTRWAYPEMKIVGVFDIDAARLAMVSRHYGLHSYESYEAALADPSVKIVVNLTSIGAHYETIKQALVAGKHVYSEKPLTKDLGQTKELFELAASRNLVLTGAPCNMFTDTVGTMWKAVQEGAIGKPVLVYAELDDNPAHLMSLDTVQSPTGAPFPYQEELQEGCTVEHVGYHLVWLCGMFGPVTSLTAFSKALIENKTIMHLDPPDTPDFSVACLNFANGLTARITCSWVAPRDHRFRIVGDEGEISADNIFHDQAPVYLERFSRVSLSARKASSLRNQPLLGRRFGIGGRKIRLVRRWKSHAVEAERGVGRSVKHKIVSWIRRKEVYAQDKLLGIAEMGRAMREGRRQPMPPDFLMHVNELTMLIQQAGSGGAVVKPLTTCMPVQAPDLDRSTGDYRAAYRGALLERALTGAVRSLHRR